MSVFRRIPSGDEFPISATLFVTYRKCPQQALARVQGVYPEPSVALLRGSLAHRIFARHLTEGPIPADDFEMVCKQEVGAHLGGTMASLSMKPSAFRAMVVEIEQLYGSFKNLPTEGFDGAEVDVDSEPYEGVRIKGRVDAVFSDEDGLRIVDWKTGGYLDDAEPQLDFYAMAWFLANEQMPKRMEAISLRTGEKRVAIPTEERVRETEARVAEMIEDLRSALSDRSDLPRMAGPHCSWCPLLDDCGEGADALRILA